MLPGLGSLDVVLPSSLEAVVDEGSVASPLDGELSISSSPGVGNGVEVGLLALDTLDESLTELLGKVLVELLDLAGVLNPVVVVLLEGLSLILVEGSVVINSLELSAEGVGQSSEGLDGWLESLLGVVVDLLGSIPSDSLGLLVDGSQLSLVVLDELSLSEVSGSEELLELSLSPGDGDLSVVGSIEGGSGTNQSKGVELHSFKF